MLVSILYLHGGSIYRQKLLTDKSFIVFFIVILVIARRVAKNMS